MSQTHKHTLTHSVAPGARHVGQNDVVNKFKDTPHWSQSVVLTACRPNSGSHLHPIRATRGPCWRTREEKESAVS